MKKFVWIAAALLLGSALLAAPTLQGQGNTSTKSPPAASKPPPGVEAAQALSTITGVAISPLLGVGAVGAWKFYHTPGEQRARLPWFAQPWFWGPALLLVALVFVKDALGPGVPTALKKPFDAAELVENKISALVVVGAFVPLVASIFHSAEQSSWLGPMGLAAIDPSPLLNLLIVPVAMVAFLIVWLAGHVINVLILVSPFGTVDAALKAFRLFLISTVTITAFMDPYVGAAWSLIILLISYLIAGWSLRLTVFGSVFAWDFLTFRRVRFQPSPTVNWVFTARKIEKVPIRTCGRLSRDEQGRLVLNFRPWLVLPRRTLVLPEGKYFVGRGLFYPEVRKIEGEEEPTQLTLPPRYRTHEEEFAKAYELGAVQDIGLRKGFKNLWRWLKGLFGFRKKAPAEVAA
ncbi:MAG: hypothetical protein HZA90_03520 [Verrucomicrobia bacterium]|nr:hypothetical protein [Verrucomicrobiota bacterium]